MRPEINKITNKCMEQAQYEEIEATIDEEMFKKLKKMNYMQVKYHSP